RVCRAVSAVSRSRRPARCCDRAFPAPCRSGRRTSRGRRECSGNHYSALLTVRCQERTRAKRSSGPYYRHGCPLRVPIFAAGEMTMRAPIVAVSLLLGMTNASAQTDPEWRQHQLEGLIYGQRLESQFREMEAMRERIRNEERTREMRERLDALEQQSRDLER